MYEAAKFNNVSQIFLQTHLIAIINLIHRKQDLAKNIWYNDIQEAKNEIEW